MVGISQADLHTVKNERLHIPTYLALNDDTAGTETRSLVEIPAAHDYSTREEIYNNEKIWSPKLLIQRRLYV